jgi:hypothetical protein
MFIYLAYEKHCETKRVEAVSRMDWLTYEEIEKLIGKVKE